MRDRSAAMSASWLRRVSSACSSSCKTPNLVLSTADCSFTSGPPDISTSIARLRSPASAKWLSTLPSRSRTSSLSCCAASTSSSCASSAVRRPIAQSWATDSLKTSGGAVSSTALSGAVASERSFEISRLAGGEAVPVEGRLLGETSIVASVSGSGVGHMMTAPMAMHAVRQARNRTVDLCDPDDSCCGMDPPQKWGPASSDAGDSSVGG